jgi:hypothetical protein
LCGGGEGGGGWRCPVFFRFSGVLQGPTGRLLLRRLQPGVVRRAWCGCDGGSGGAGVCTEPSCGGRPARHVATWHAAGRDRLGAYSSTSVECPSLPMRVPIPTYAWAACSAWCHPLEGLALAHLFHPTPILRPHPPTQTAVGGLLGMVPPGMRRGGTGSLPPLSTGDPHACAPPQLLARSKGSSTE